MDLSFSGDLSRFVALGVKIDYSCNVKFMQVPIAGSAEFVREWVATKMGVINKNFAGRVWVEPAACGSIFAQESRPWLQSVILFACVPQGPHR